MWKSAKTSRRAVFSKSGGNSTEEEKQATRQKKQQKPPRKVNPLGDFGTTSVLRDNFHIYLVTLTSNTAGPSAQTHDSVGSHFLASMLTLTGQSQHQTIQNQTDIWPHRRVQDKDGVPATVGNRRRF